MHKSKFRGWFPSIDLRFTQKPLGQPSVWAFLALSQIVTYVCIRGGEGEIRTLGELPHSGFQDRCTKPLCDLSVYAVTTTIITDTKRLVECLAGNNCYPNMPSPCRLECPGGIYHSSAGRIDVVDQQVRRRRIECTRHTKCLRRLFHAKCSASSSLGVV